jgi:hypothetical protein
VAKNKRMEVKIKVEIARHEIYAQLKNYAWVFVGDHLSNEHYQMFIKWKNWRPWIALFCTSFYLDRLTGR